MPYTEMDNITSSKLALISERARKDPKFQFISLAHLLNEGFMKECYYDLGRDRASGIDGVSWKEYGEKLDENIKDLVARLNWMIRCLQVRVKDTSLLLLIRKREFTW